MIRSLKTGNRTTISLALLVLICCVIFASADDSNGTIVLNNTSGISGNGMITGSPTEIIPVTPGTGVTQNPVLLQTTIPPLTAVISPVLTKVVETTPVETQTMSSNESLCSKNFGNTALTSSKAQSFATNTLESMSSSSSWDVAVRFDNAPGNNFYPFSSSAGVVGTPYYAVLDSSDNLVKWIPYCYRGCGWDTCYWASLARASCYQVSTPCSSLDPLTSGCVCYSGVKNGARMDGWFVERTRISDTKYRIKIVGVSVNRADPSGELWLNPDSGWKFTQLDSCSVQADQGYPKRPVSCAQTSDTMLKFQAAGDCGSGCACEDAGNVNIDVIVEKTAAQPEPPTYSITQVGNTGSAFFQDISSQVDLDATMLSNAFESDTKIKWRKVFWNKETAVTKENLGTNGGGLNDAIFHYHAGHGAKDWFFWGNTYLALSNGQSLHANEVKRMWGKQNKWVWLDSCDILSDPSWSQALSTTHGIFGYANTEWTGAKTKTDFIALAQGTGWHQGRAKPLSIAYIQATKANQPPSVTAAVIFGNTDQYRNDYLPGHGSMAPDKNPGDHSYVYYEWQCAGTEVK